MREFTCGNCETIFAPKWMPKPNKSGLNFCCKQCSILYAAKTREKSGPSPQGQCITCKAATPSRFKKCKDCKIAKFTEADRERVLAVKVARTEKSRKDPTRKGKKCSCCPNLVSQGNSSGICEDCFKEAGRLKILKTPIKNFLYKNKGATNQYTRARELSRRLAIEATSAQSCSVCGYSVYVEVCHIKAISEFDENTLMEEVNSLANLTFLCPNHHKEFDKNLSDIVPISIANQLS